MQNFKDKAIRARALTATLLSLSVILNAQADEVTVLAADFHRNDNSLWSVSVTLKHGDTGWDHYADRWRIVDSDGNILGERLLLHPHVEEQPFTRSLDRVKVPGGITTVYVEAHDKVHGWTTKRLPVDLGKAIDGNLRVSHPRDTHERRPD